MDCDFDRLLEMFATMNGNGFDTTKPLKWGFFFMDSAAEPLRCVLKELEGFDYQLERLEPSEPGCLKSASVRCWRPRNCTAVIKRLTSWRSICGAELYDGWDVGYIDQ